MFGFIRFPKALQQFINGLRQQVYAVVDFLVFGQELFQHVAVQADFIIAESLLAVCGSSNSHIDGVVTLRAIYFFGHSKMDKNALCYGRFKISQ